MLEKEDIPIVGVGLVVVVTSSENEKQMTSR
jgi:hypothetical protein